MLSFKIRMYECKHSTFKFLNFNIFCKALFLTMESSDYEGLSQLHLELVDVYKKRFIAQNEQVPVLKSLQYGRKLYNTQPAWTDT